MISLLSFVQTGRLGDVGLGATRDEVEEKFGMAELWGGSRQKNKAPIWKYGDIEIYFEDDVVWMIFADDFTVPHMGKVAFDAGGICAWMDRVQMEQWFVANEITFSCSEYPPCDEGVRFETNSGVTFTFCAEEKELTAFLVSFSIARR